MASFTVPCPKTSVLCNGLSHSNPRSASFGSDLGSLVPRFQGSAPNRFDGLKVSATQLNDIAVAKSSNSAPFSEKKLEEELPKSDPVADAASISAFMSQAAHLIKLVDSRDIVELQLKQSDCEILIRKKEALPQPVVAAPPVMAQPSVPQAVFQQPQLPAPDVAARGGSPSPPPPVAPPKPSSSHPSLKCPMAGTFYRCPAPGAPPFVKVGDKVQKGQVVCIIEAMKLMNEIEADQAGTILEILAEDGKPVSMDMPLFSIAP